MGEKGPDFCAMTTVSTKHTMRKVFANHDRRWQDFHYVYPVVSRRSGGLSIGINLNIDKACNFDCVYCCVDRSVEPVRLDVDLKQVHTELERMLELVTTGKLWRESPFTEVAPAYRRVNDIAFSGDGEPTAYPHFDQACQIAVQLKRQCGLADVKIVVITNATMFNRSSVRRAFRLLDENQGEIWAKLDAGTEPYYHLIDRTRFPMKKVLEHILTCGRTRPIVVQSLFMQVNGEPVPDSEFDAYLHRLQDLRTHGCQIKEVQLYTTARRTAEAYVTPLTDQHLDRLACRFRQLLPDMPLGVYYAAV